MTLSTRNSFPSNFMPLEGTPEDCRDCGSAARVGFRFDYAFQPIVDVDRRSVFAHEALVRGPNGERDCLRDAGVRLMQGYLFARPAFSALAAVDPQAWASGLD